MNILLLTASYHISVTTLVFFISLLINSYKALPAVRPKHNIKIGCQETEKSICSY